MSNPLKAEAEIASLRARVWKLEAELAESRQIVAVQRAMLARYESEEE